MSRDLRLECLKLAHTRAVKSEEVLALADRYVAYVLGSGEIASQSSANEGQSEPGNHKSGQNQSQKASGKNK